MANGASTSPAPKLENLPMDPSQPSLLSIKSFGIAADASSQAYLSERVGDKLGKFGLQLHGLEIRVKRLGWAGDQPRISCALSATLDGGATVAVERSAPAAREAFDHAMGVAERMIRRTLQQRRHRQH
jgi:hypothetical protein